MIITEWTKYVDFAPFDKYVRGREKKSIMQAAEKRLGSVWGLTIGRFAELIKGRFEIDENTTVLEVYWWRRFEEFCDEFAKICKRFTIKQDAHEMRAAQGLPEMSIVEGMLVFAKDYFGLHSFSDAEKITLGDFVLAKKASFINMTYQKRLQQIKLSEMKSRSKK